MKYHAKRDGVPNETDNFFQVYAGRKHLGLIAHDEREAKLHHADPSLQSEVERFLESAFILRPKKKTAAMIAFVVAYHAHGYALARRATRSFMYRFLPLVATDTDTIVNAISLSREEVFAEVMEGNIRSIASP